MRVTSQSIAYTAVGVVFGGVNAYANPVRFIFSFAIGIIVGAALAKPAYEQVMDSNTEGREAQDARRRSVKRLCSFLPGPVTAIASLCGYVFRHVSKGSQFDYTAGIASPLMLGLSVGTFFYFNQLRSLDLPDVKRQLRMAAL